MSTSHTELWELSAGEQAGLVVRGEASPTEVVRSALQRMDEVEPFIHAFSVSTAEAALEEAERQEKALASGEAVGPLAGVPVGVKDLIATKGVVTACGSAAYRDFVPEEDDVVVERLRAAGAIMIGKTNVPEFGYSGVGHNPIAETTRNPWDLRMTPGGSSAGSGAAVAAGVCPFALGSDGGGSVRIPSAHCGLFGFKASMGRVPLYPGCRDERYPGISSWESLEHIGPMARSVEDAALMMTVIAGPDPRDRHSIPCTDVDWMAALERPSRRLRVAYCPDFGYVAVDPEVRSLVEGAVRSLADAIDCDVEERNPGWDDPFPAFWGIVALDTDLRGMREMVAEHRHEMTPHVVDFIDRDWTAEDFTDAVRGRKAFVNSMWRFMGDFDILVTPTLTVPPFPVHMQGPEKVDGRIVSPFAWLSFTLPINLTGQPAATVPAGWTQDGLPVGMQIVGRHLDDATVLAVSAAFQEAHDWRGRRPAVVQATEVA
ncbi:MAG: aspartyl-tRNA(Asn)/glutamyl-tRNA(Gln) amidotransferase subunit [Solirubrobacteraceae bacterium]|nr:aspartyl-tRNA(Asn)/glutamyl-tRNA(Gln) amidotransferase subunit [Solirubrobacteraceae bacterium]